METKALEDRAKCTMIEADATTRGKASHAIKMANRRLYHRASKNMKYHRRVGQRIYGSPERAERAYRAFLQDIIAICTYDPKNPPITKLKKARRGGL